MKVSELEGAVLDYWVARAEGYDRGLNIEPKFGICEAPAMPDDVQLQGIGSGTSDIFSPSRHWEQGGPIIERERIMVTHTPADGAVCWHATADEYATTSDGPTPLVAAMRAYVASKFGEDVTRPQG